jgi:hypothetical protein
MALIIVSSMGTVLLFSMDVFLYGAFWLPWGPFCNSPS